MIRSNPHSDILMFSVTTEQRQYLTYILSDTIAKSTIEIVPERGGIVTSWKVQQSDQFTEIFYIDKERFTHPDLSVRGGNPILFPICGNMPDNAYTYDGKTYQLKQHGFARDLPWQVVDQSAETGASLSVSLSSSDFTREGYPFEFQVIFTYILQGNKLTIEQEFENKSDKPMPFAVGFHPYFTVADKEKLEIQIPGAEYFDKARTSYTFDGNLDFNQEEIDIAFEQLSAQVATVTDRDQQLRLTLDWNQNFSTLVFWTVKDKDFYCLEPWTSPRNAMNTNKNLLIIPPQESLKTSVSMAVEALS